MVATKYSTLFEKGLKYKNGSKEVENALFKIINSAKEYKRIDYIISSQNNTIRGKINFYDNGLLEVLNRYQEAEKESKNRNLEKLHIEIKGLEKKKLRSHLGTN